MSAGEEKSLLWCDVWMGASCVPDKLFWYDLGMELLLVFPEVQLVYVAHPEGALITF